MHFRSCIVSRSLAAFGCMLLFMIGGLFSAKRVHAEENTLIAASLASVDYAYVAENAEYLMDRTGNLTLENVRASSAWQPVAAKQFNQGWTDDTIWLRIVVSNENYAERSYILEIKNALLDQVVFYLLNPADTAAAAIKPKGEWGDHVKRGFPNAVTRMP
ncbi:MAG TPA: 7TM-DISM domain-containing protein, partial [Pseudomonadales bacterium]|nr:7TM-DISM domain-containing protein [Pseudomonadales bacterium]